MGRSLRGQILIRVEHRIPGSRRAAPRRACPPGARAAPARRLQSSRDVASPCSGAGHGARATYIDSVTITALFGALYASLYSGLPPPRVAGWTGPEARRASAARDRRGVRAGTRGPPSPTASHPHLPLAPLYPPASPRFS